MNDTVGLVKVKEGIEMEGSCTSAPLTSLESFQNMYEREQNFSRLTQSRAEPPQEVSEEPFVKRWRGILRFSKY